jgi:hypothetical protein
MNGVVSALSSGNTQVILAIIVVVEAGVIAYLYRELISSTNGRLQDFKETNDKIQALLSPISQTVTMIYEKLRDGRK